MGAVVQFGGQTAIKLAKALTEMGVQILGTSADGVDAAEDRERFDEILEKCAIPRAKGRTVYTTQEALQAANELGYPVLVRPSYVLGGQGMEIALYDIDGQRLEQSAAILEAINKGNGCPASIRSYLGAENRRKALSGADFVITQLFFDVREYESLVSSLRAAGLETPVIPGILPIQSLESIRRTLSLCGANIPGKLYLALEEANAKGGAEAVREAGLKFAVQQIRTLLDNGAPGIHLYTLNKASMCLRIAEEVGAL